MRQRLGRRQGAERRSLGSENRRGWSGFRGFGRLCFAGVTPQVRWSEQLRTHHGRNPIPFQENREGLKALPLKSGESVHGRYWVWHTRCKSTPAPTHPYKRHRFPSEI